MQWSRSRDPFLDFGWRSQPGGPDVANQAARCNLQQLPSIHLAP
jgi:hypothetical protein